MDIEKLRRKRGRKSKKELEFIKNYELENNIVLNENADKKPKKRGRKPKGGKIVKNIIEEEDDSNSNVQNIILHLKCNDSDIENNRHFLTDFTYNPEIESVKPYNSNSYVNNDSNSLQYFDIEVQFDESCEKRNIDQDEYVFNYTVEVEDSETDCKSKKECVLENKKIIWDKLKTIQNNLNNNTIGSKKSDCFWCMHGFENPPIYIPKSQMNNNYSVYGCFCTPQCAVAYLCNENIESSCKWERYSMINNIYKCIYNYADNIKPAPSPFYILDKFYGDLSIEEYRQLNCDNNNVMMIVEKPLTRILPELFQDNTDVTNTQETKSKYRLSRTNPPINKTTVDNKKWLF